MQPLRFENNILYVLDQTKLPGQIDYLEIDSCAGACEAIKNLSVRGAPAIGIAAGYGIALAALAIEADDMPSFLAQLEKAASAVKSTRPTAQNLFQVAARMLGLALNCSAPDDARVRLVQEAFEIHREQMESDLLLSKYGAEIVADNSQILTHCNTGSLATGGYGTALGVIKYAFSEGKQIKVIATETRPLLQGSRLTALELREAGIPFALITDSMAGYLMSLGKINMVITGADRIAANGDTANKIGTYSLAVLAGNHDVPFYIAAPTTTFDKNASSGKDIPIEERGPQEVTHFNDQSLAPTETPVINPAFDITPSKYITGFITEKGVFGPDEITGLLALP
jgi:methylthioribose-1-phosphate isomerase